MSAGELACSYAAMILSDDGIPITAEKISTLIKAANVNIECYWPGLFAKLFEKKSLEDLIMTVGSGQVSAAAVAPAGTAAGTPAAAAAEAKKEEPKEESEDEEDFSFNLFE